MANYSSRLSFLAIALFFATALLAQSKNQPQPQPQPDPLPPPIAAPVDKPYVGPVKLTVDLTDNARRVASVHEDISAEPGAKELVLLYPQWIPGSHSPNGPISKLGGIVTTVDGQRVQWVRDRVNVYAFHVPLAAGSKYATALETASIDGATVTFKRTSLNQLIDSPVYSGVNYKRIELSPTPTDKVFLDVFADAPEDLNITPEQLETHQNLAAEADKLYGSHHYDHYDFLLLLSDKVSGIGLEHHQSSEDGLPANYFTNWAAGVGRRDLLGHEYTHSWDGKFRRPADLWTPNFNVPMRDDLLWVYEGMTQYFGNVLTARSGMRTPDETREVFARVAAGFEISPGREWRPLVDTTNQPTVSQRTPVTWVSWQRPEDYYTEAALIWLDADTKIRELTGGQKSLDDFAKF